MKLEFDIFHAQGRVQADIGIWHINDNMREIIKLGEQLRILMGTENTVVFRKVITDNIRVKDGKVYLEARWPKDLCRDGGLSKYPFIAIQIALFRLQKSIEDGEVECKFYLNGAPMRQAWPNIPNRAQDDKMAIKSLKKKHPTGAERIGCPGDARTKRNEGCVPACCMCNKKEKLILK